MSAYAIRGPAGPRFLGRPHVRVALVLLILAPLVVAAFAALLPSGLSPVVLSGVGSAALDHPTRAKILGHLEAVPGDHFRSIVRSVQVSVGEVRHHLNVLLRKGSVRESKQQNLCRYYVRSDGATDRNQVFEAYWSLKDCRGRVLQAVRQRQVVRPSDVAFELGISRQLAAYHLGRLADAGALKWDQGRYRL